MPAKSYVFYRGYDTMYEPVSDRPAYFGSFSTAHGYSKLPDRKLAAFTNTRSLLLLDIRFMKDLLREMFATHTITDTAPVKSVMVSLGTCSLYHQYRLASERFKHSKLLDENLQSVRKFHVDSDIEQPGIRIAETTNDACTMGFLKTLFAGFVDGFISPKQFSPFHTEKVPSCILHAEMILFDPADSGIVMLNTLPPITRTVDMDIFHKQTYNSPIHIGTPSYGLDFYTHTGGGDADETHRNTVLPTIEQISNRLSTDPEIQTAWNQGLEAGAQWKRIAGGFTFFRHPHVEVKDWNTPSLYPPDDPYGLDKYIIRKKRRFTAKQKRSSAVIDDVYPMRPRLPLV